MKQFNIRSEKARDIAQDLSRVLGKPMAEIVEDALENYKATVAAKAYEDWLWGAALEETRKRVKESLIEFRVADLYDAETGLPA